MKIEGNKFLVTGGAGFIGSHLVDMLLEEGAAKVVIFDNFVRGGMHNLEEALNDKRAEFFKVKGDLTHLDEIEGAVKDMDGVFHLASLCLAHCQDYPRAALDANIVGTFNLLDTCARNGIKRVMFASSSSIYGDAVYSPMDEKHPLETRNFYGATKIAGEALCRAFYFKYGLDYLAFRFMNVYGPRQDHLGVYIAVIIKIIERLQYDLPPILYGDGLQAFDFVFVRDACRSLILGMGSSLSSECYNVSSGRQTSVLKLCEMISVVMGKNIAPVFKPVQDHTLVTNRIGSTEKAKKDLGFISGTSLEEGLRKVVEWKLSQPWENMYVPV